MRGVSPRLRTDARARSVLTEVAIMALRVVLFATPIGW